MPASTCTGCGISYGELRTGVSYRDAWSWQWNADYAAGGAKSPGVVLGMLARLKRQMWAEHLRTCEPNQEDTMSDRFSLLDSDSTSFDPSTFADDAPVRAIDMDDAPAAGATRVLRVVPPPARPAVAPGVTILEDARVKGEREQELLRQLCVKDNDRQFYTTGTAMLAEGIATAKRHRAEWEARPVLVDGLARVAELVTAECRRDLPITLASERVDASGMFSGMALDGNAWSQLCQRAPAGFPTRLRSNVNLWLPSSDTSGVLRTRHLTPTAPRLAFALVSDRYAAVDLDKVAAIAARALPRDTHVTHDYDADTTKWQIDASLAPTFDTDGEIGVGRVHRAGIRLTGADNGTQGIRAAFYAERIRCINCTLITSEGLQFHKIHVGNVDALSELLAGAMGKISDAIDLFGAEWRAANEKRMHDAYDGSPLGAIETFRRLVAHGFVNVPGETGAVAVETLMQAWNAEPGDTVAAVNRAITRAAHTGDWGTFDAAELEGQAGALLFNHVYELPRLNAKQEQAFQA